MNFSDKMIKGMFEIINKPEMEGLRVKVLETAVKSGKMPTNPTIEQIKQVQTDFMVGMFCYLVHEDKRLFEMYSSEVYHTLREEPCDQF
jgi:hypothetical protein